MTRAGELALTPVDPADMPALARHVAFENAHGRARFTVEEFAEWLPRADDVLLVQAFDRAGTLVGCATASVVLALAGSIQLNAFFPAGKHEILERLVEYVEQWEVAAAASTLVAHVSDPSPEHEQAWLRAGFRRIGRRTGLERRVSADTVPHPDTPAGIEIVPLAQRPELAATALELWNEGHAAIPSALPFRSVDEAGWRRELGIEPEEPFPPSLLVATTAGGDVAGLVFVDLISREHGIAGHRFTTTAPAWRGRGVATALKAAAIHWAARSGIGVLRASNDDGNEAMRSINERLGYQPQYRLVLLQRELPARRHPR